jgi:hypothetical protein
MVLVFPVCFFIQNTFFYSFCFCSLFTPLKATTTTAMEIHGGFATIATGVVTTFLLLLLSTDFASITTFINGYAFESTSLSLTTISTSSKNMLTARSIVDPLSKYQRTPIKSRWATINSHCASRHYQSNSVRSNPTSTALPLYFDPSTSLSTKKHLTHRTPSALSYRNDKNVDTEIVSLVEGIYKNDKLVLKSDENIDQITSAVPPKKSYLLLIGVEEESPTAHHPPLENASRQPPNRPLMTLMSDEGMMERLRPENGVQLYQPDCTVVPSSLPTKASSSKKPKYNQRISFFEGGEPFFSLSNIEYGVSSNVINDAASTGALVALMVFVAMMNHLFAWDNYHDYSSDDFLNNMKLTSSLVLSVSAATAYLSITRSTVGTLTRTMSTFWMNWMRLMIVSGTKATEIVADASNLVKDIVIGATMTNLTTNDVTAIPAVVSPASTEANQPFERVEPLPSIPVLMGELVWYSSLAVVQQTKNFLTKTTDSILNYQVDMVRMNRLQCQERKQRNLLEAQIHYSKSTTKKQQQFVKQHEDQLLVDEKECTSEVMTNIYESNLHVFLLGDSERDEILNTDATLHLYGNIDTTKFNEYDRDGMNKNLFQLGVSEREDMLIKTQTHQLFGNIESIQRNDMVVSRDDQYVTTPDREGLFYLGQLERDEVNVEMKTHSLFGNVENVTRRLVTPNHNRHLFQLGQEERDDLNMAAKSHSLLGNIEVAPQSMVASRHRDRLFELGQEEREEHLLGNLMNFTQNLDVSKEESDMKSQSEHLFYLGGSLRDDMLTSNATIQLFGNIEQCQQEMPTVSRDNDREVPNLAEVHRLIQERARTETKKRLHALAESKLSFSSEGPIVEFKEVQEPIKNEFEVIEIDSLKAFKRKRSWKGLSHKVGKVKKYLMRQSKMITGSADRYTLVQRGALHFVAATTSLFANHLGTSTGYSKRNITDI